ncbi:hypothetical protein BKA70DRAFT_1457399 [Coprinopsis sp. MPI-PUGE-AT-0042]|nr:hypothetical protein BKA70DRAFT_1457399 [Coprinopsis sp. MPI-PUGE-AT-0042]
MPAPDLPAELWLEILSYLPSSSFVKLIGVNRIFFELAFDYKYKEVRLLSRDPSTLHTFEQLRVELAGDLHPGIACEYPLTPSATHQHAVEPSKPIVLRVNHRASTKRGNAKGSGKNNECNRLFPQVVQDLSDLLLIYSLVVYDISPLFDKLDQLPNLKKLALLFPACGSTSSNPSSLVNFLLRQSATLEHLVLDQKPPHSVFCPSTSGLGGFLAHEFTRVELTEVHTLQVASEMLPPRLVPDILPRLRHLIVDPRSPSGVSSSALPQILESTGGVLESLDIRLWNFSTEALDLLASRCPQLRRLTLGYSQCTSLQVTDKFQPYSGRQYPQWPLEYVRLGRLGECGEMHPDAGMMKAVAHTVLPRVVEKDIERRCPHLTS